MGSFCITPPPISKPPQPKIIDMQTKSPKPDLSHLSIYAKKIVDQLYLQRNKIELLLFTITPRPKLLRYAFKNRIQLSILHSPQQVCDHIQKSSKNLILLYTDQILPISKIQAVWKYIGYQHLLVLLLDYRNSIHCISQQEEYNLLSKGIMLQGLLSDAVSNWIQKYLVTNTGAVYQKIALKGSSILVQIISNLRVLRSDRKFQYGDLEQKIDVRGNLKLDSNCTVIRNRQNKLEICFKRKSETKPVEIKIKLKTTSSNIQIYKDGVLSQIKQVK